MLRRLFIALASVIVLIGIALAVVLWMTRPPDAGAFYDPPDIAAATAPGTVLRSAALERGVPGGARAWRILYVSRDDQGAPIAVSGMVIAGGAAANGPRAVLAWAHGTTGIVSGCAPTLLEDPLASIPGLAAILARGWVVVATDYPGLGTPGGHPYLVGRQEGRSVIDSVRAVRELDTGLAIDNRYVVWGESQGGHAALFAGQVDREGYAPEIDLLGVGAAAPATDLGPLLEAAQGSPGGKILTALAADSWSRVYPELSFDAAVVPRGRTAARAIARRCLAPAFFVVAAQAALIPTPMLAIDLSTDPAWSVRARENTPSAPIYARVLVLQGRRDMIVSPAIQRAWVAERCRDGQPIDFVDLPDSGHIDVMRAAGPILLDWTTRLFAGTSVPRGCRAAGS